MMRFTLAIAAYIFARQVLAQEANITASTCTTPDGFTSCYQPAASTFNDCATGAGTDLTKWMECSCTLLKTELSCAQSNCWNVAYGCEYQSLANLVTTYCDGKDIPYYPAPENAPGGCSCNLGYVSKNMTAVIDQYQICSKDASSDADKQSACDCCVQSGVYTSQYSICPNTDPSLIEGSKDTWILQYLPPLDSCSASFEKYNCVRDLKFPDIGSVTYLSASPTNIGTATLSTLSGTITSPPQITTSTGSEQTATAASSSGAASPSVSSLSTNGASCSSGEGGLLMIVIALMIMFSS